MVMSSSQTLRRAVARSWSYTRRPLLASSIATGSAAAGYLAFSQDEAVRGLRRQANFWSRVIPVVGDYYWNFGSYSPYVKYRQVIWNKTDENDEYKERLQALHIKHAPTLLQVMVDLRGLYIKLGQVLSVTALPVPETFREQFRKLQSNVAGWEDFETIVKPIIETELGVENLDELFESVDTVPCGAASIGQAHKARLLETEQDIILKIQYPDASWQVPADISCVGALLKICVLAGVVDESASKLSFSDFSRQFLAELDYGAERRNLEQIYESSLDQNSPYVIRNVVVPKVLPELCSPHILAMTYLPGPKLEEEAHRQLKRLGIDTRRQGRKLVDDESSAGTPMFGQYRPESSSRGMKILQRLGNSIGLDNIIWAVRWMQRIMLWSNGITANAIGALPSTMTPASWQEWATSHKSSLEQAQRLSMTSAWVDALMDVHGHQVFQLGLFNADPHPGNILVVQNETGQTDSGTLGLIDFGQCKRLSVKERKQIAKLVLSVANDESDGTIASAFRDLGIRTKNDSTPFLATFARLMFGPLKAEYFSHSFHQELHKMDHVDYFPTELSMVYRNALLLRGLAMSLQQNPSVSEHWKKHAEVALAMDDEEALTKSPSSTASSTLSNREAVQLLSPSYA